MKLNVRGFLTNNRSLKVISLIIAFIAWFVVVSSVSDDGRYPISDVPVDTEEFSTAVMAQLGLEAVDIDNVTVDVVVEGKRYVIGNLTAEDIRIVPDLSAVREAGTYSIPLEATTTGSEEFDIVSIRPSTITVRFDRFASKRLEVEADVSGVSTSEGYLIENEIVSPQEIIITGPEADVSRVSRAVVTAEVDELLTSTYSVSDMFFGNIGGSLGEISALLLLAGGLYLIWRKVISWHTPVAYIATVAVLAFLFPRYGASNVEWMVYSVLGGGVMLGAFFMATDYTTSPVTKTGQLIFGIGCGLLTMFIRYFGSYNEGVCYSIMIMNLLVALIDKNVKASRFGVVKSAEKKEAASK